MIIQTVMIYGRERKILSADDISLKLTLEKILILLRRERRYESQQTRSACWINGVTQSSLLGAAETTKRRKLEENKKKMKVTKVTMLLFFEKTRPSTRKWYSGMPCLAHLFLSVVCLLWKVMIYFSSILLQPHPFIQAMMKRSGCKVKNDVNQRDFKHRISKCQGSFCAKRIFWYV